MASVTADLVPMVAPRAVRVAQPSDSPAVPCARDVTCDLVPFAPARAIRVCDRGGR
ncbi:hypothetical protein EV660_11722 [Roseinatronobacter bogoriensis DSM 18756]|nr:hypothetical protein [Rhodobaca bogoriensis DSM 18756]TDY65754.1 hypothetical protein EV660_11722 [Rhodobaca bogoriensis DSM 18756]